MEVAGPLGTPLGLVQRKRASPRGDMDSAGEGEGGEILGNGIETCIISCMKRVASLGSMHDTGCLGLVHWDDPGGWNGEGGGRRVHPVEGLMSVRAKYLFSVPNLAGPLLCSWVSLRRWPRWSRGALSAA